ncbi:MAG: hypothetical protein VX320_05695 [Candidatus Thermoplasmatota archaeon]|nr:hypothetical protein [Candidatus Thermoplasmatota archaeon]
MPRITNRERVLLALEDANEYADRYEVPRRFSQSGLAGRLEMAQSHVSRAINRLSDENLLRSERRRVAGERRRVMAYALTEKGQYEADSLHRELLSCDILTTAKDGTLEMQSAKELFGQWERRGWSQPADGLGVADLLRTSEQHEGHPRIDAPPTQADEPEADLSSETIGLHLELANLRRAQNDIPGAIDHLKRAAELHRVRGSKSGEARCLLAAVTLGAVVEEPERMLPAVEKIKNHSLKLDSLLIVHDAMSVYGNDLEEVINRLEKLDSNHPEVLLRRYESSLKSGQAGPMQNFSPHSSIFAANVMRVRCLAAEQGRTEWPECNEILSVQNAHKQPTLAAALALAASNHPQISDSQMAALLSLAWDLKPPLPLLGHIGFRLSSHQDNEAASMTLEILSAAFESIGDSRGVDVCSSRIAGLNS